MKHKDNSPMHTVYKLVLTLGLATILQVAGSNYVYAMTPCPAGAPPAGECCVGGGIEKDNCGAGFLPDKTAVPGDCVCVPANKALSDMFEIVNGIMIPITVIGGLFLIVLAGYRILTSQGDPTKLQEGKDSLTSAIIGLIFALMAVSILRVIIKALITGNSDPFI